MKISEYIRNTDTTPTASTSIAGFLSDIKSGRWKDLVEYVRLSQNEVELKSRKKSAPGVTISGTFLKRDSKSLIAHSGYIAIDIDGISPNSVKEEIGADEYVYSIFSSISGNGACAIFYIKDHNHWESFRGIVQYIREKYNIEVDTSGSDIGRFRYVSYDPDIIINDEYRVFDKQISSPVKSHLGSKNETPISEIYKIAEAIQASGVDVTESYSDWSKIGFIIADEIGEAGREAFHIISSNYTEYSREVVDNQYNESISKPNASINPATISSLYYYLKKAGVNIRNNSDAVTPPEESEQLEKLVDFPIEVFPEFIQEYIRECNRTLDASVDIMASAMLWSTSVILGNSLRVEVKTGWIEKPSVWVAVVGEAGVGKTPMLKHVIGPLQNINIDQVKDYNKRHGAWLAFDKLSESEKKREGNKMTKPKSFEFIVGDATIEALGDLHQDNPRGVGTFRDELIGWIQSMNQYRAGSDRSVWLSSWAGAAWSMRRKTATSTYVNDPFMPVLGGIQPSILPDLFADTKDEDGFIERTLLCYPELDISHESEDEIDPHMLRKYESYIRSMYRYVTENLTHIDEHNQLHPITAKLSVGAKKKRREISNRITDAQNSHEDSAYINKVRAKMKSYIPRFAILLDFLNKFNGKNNPNDFMEVSEESMVRAEKLYSYFVAMSRKCKNSVQGTDTMNFLLEKTKGKKAFDRFKVIYSSDNEINKTQIAVKLNVSRRTVINWANKIDKENGAS
ncbi:MAG: DUF3987 domain-containing protein [Sphingobacterium sp.]